MTNQLQRIHRRNLGFSLIELMVALAIGLIATIGIVSLFSNTSRSNRLQEGLARLQENGRYAALRMEDDMRRVGGQFCSNSSGNRQIGSVAPLWQDRSPWIFAANLGPTAAPSGLPDSGGMQSVNPTTGGAQPAAATAPYALSTRFLMQGYTCNTTSTCIPAAPSTLPAPGLTDGQRVPNTDMLTIRYQRGSGWPISGTGNCAAGGTLTLAPQLGDDPVNITTGSLALVSDCQSPYVIPISNVAGNALTVAPRLPGTLPCRALATRDVRVFNFSQDFVTITYYLGFRTNDNPDARPNAGGLRLVPSLIRRENGVDQVIVQGVDRLNFRYGVRDRGGNMRFLTAQEVQTAAIPCPPKPDGVAPSPGDPLASEPGCLWRSVRRVEASMLVNSGEEVLNLDPISRSYQYMGTTFTPTDTDTAALTTGLMARSYPRREFIAHATHRNKTP